MSMDGMDIEQAQGIARQLSGNSQALASIIATVTRVAAELSCAWQGPVSATFQQQWTTTHQPGLAGATTALADMHTHLVANINQQITASAADGSPAGGSSPDGGILGKDASRVWTDVSEVAGYEGLVQTPIDQVVNIAGKDNLFTSPYGKAWSEVMKLDKDGDFLQYKESPVLNALHDSPRVQSVANFLGETHPAAVLKGVDFGLSVVGGIATGVDAYKTGEDLGKGDYGQAVADAANTTGDVLMTSKNPVAFFAGADIKLVTLDVQLAQQVDWKNIPNPFSGDNWSTDYVPAFKQVPGQFVSNLAKVF